MKIETLEQLAEDGAASRIVPVEPLELKHWRGILRQLASKFKPSKFIGIPRYRNGKFTREVRPSITVRRDHHSRAGGHRDDWDKEKQASTAHFKNSRKAEPVEPEDLVSDGD